jgi:hypothetical protein
VNLPPPEKTAYSLRRAAVWTEIVADIQTADDPEQWLEAARARRMPVAIVYWTDLPESWRELLEELVAHRKENRHVPT